MISVRDMSAAELSALLAFHADAGVDWLVDDQPIDRIAQFASERAARANPVSRQAAENGGQINSQASTQTSTRERTAPPAPRPASSTPVVIPDETAISDARLAAASANSLAELKMALTGFASCNLKTSARSTIFTEGSGESGIMIIGPNPSADDDREGLAFSGRAGGLLDRMLSAIDLKREALFLTTAMPWRAPGDRMPTKTEAEICRPFIERQIALAQPRAVLLLGNFTARFFFGGVGTIHSMRGDWRDVAAGDHSVPALATFHPQELLLAPATKAIAWRDLLHFKAALSA
jgi:uracil-DNA glycosylase